MKCVNEACANKRNIKKTLEDFDYSETSGIPGCILQKVPTYRCPKCGSTVRDLGDEKEAADAVATVLLARDVLTRQDIKFLRTQFFEESYFEFGKRPGTNPTILRELEARMRTVSPELSHKIQEAILRKRAGAGIKIIFET